MYCYLCTATILTFDAGLEASLQNCYTGQQWGGTRAHLLRSTGWRAGNHLMLARRGHVCETKTAF